MLRNPRGATSLRWLRALLDHGIEVRGQLVVCPGVNDGRALDDTLAGILDEYPELSSVAVVPLGISRFNPEAAMRRHTRAEAAAVVDAVEDWQDVYRAALGRRLVHAADEYYLMAEPTVPGRPTSYEGFTMHEDGIGMARTFELEFTGAADDATGVRRGFFAAVDAPARAVRATDLPAQPGRLHRAAVGPADVAGRRCGRGGRRRSASCPASSAPGSSARSSPASVATTCASSPSPTSSSAATPA